MKISLRIFMFILVILMSSRELSVLDIFSLNKDWIFKIEMVEIISEYNALDKLL